MNIPDTELMAEKLGIIKLCELCGERIEEKETQYIDSVRGLIRGIRWVHIKGGCTTCPPELAKIYYYKICNTTYMNIDLRRQAIPRNLSIINGDDNEYPRY
jgi:hypothetical protein